MSRFHRPALVSVVVAGALVLVAVVRLLSYSRGSGLAGWLQESALGFLAYRPDSAASVRFFKILATPSVVAGQYFLFRLLNHLHSRNLPPGYDAAHRRIDFRPAGARLALTTLVTLHWVVIEWYKFGGPDRYPFSPLERPAINAVVLLLSQAVAFFGMKYLSFEPLLRQRG